MNPWLRHIALGLLVLVSAQGVVAQSDLVLPMLRFVPQRNRVNPAYFVDAKTSLGLPLLSSNHIGLGNSGFAYSDLVVKSADDSLHFDANSLASALGNSNLLNVNVNIDLISYTGRIGKKNHLSINITERIMARAVYPKDLINFALNGNTQYVGQTVDFSGLEFDATHLREYAVGFARQMAKDKLVVGFRLKYLYGMENISSDNRGLSIATDAEYFDVTANADLTINSSGFFGDGGFSSIGASATNYLFKRNNHGFAVDLGLTYKIKEKWNIGFSLTDLGGISWKEAPNNQVIDGAGFTFKGVPLDQLASHSGDSANFLTTLLDSMVTTLGLDEKNESYSTMLPTRFQFMAGYDIDPKSAVTLTFNGEVFKGHFDPTVAIGINRQFGKTLGLGLSYAYQNGSFANLGVGFALTVGPLQWYMSFDNILGVITPQHTQTAQFHGGLNIVVGAGKGAADKKKSKEEDNTDTDGDTVPDRLDECPKTPGRIDLQGCPDSDGDGVVDRLDHCIWEPGPAEWLGCPEPQ